MEALQNICQLSIKLASLHEHHSDNQELSDDNLLYIPSPRLMTKGTEHTESDICCLARVNADTKLSLVISGCCKRTSFVLVWIRILKYLFRICSQFKVWFDVKNSSSKNTVDSGHKSFHPNVSLS